MNAASLPFPLPEGYIPPELVPKHSYLPDFQEVLRVLCSEVLAWERAYASLRATEGTYIHRHILPRNVRFRPTLVHLWSLTRAACSYPLAEAVRRALFRVNAPLDLGDFTGHEIREFADAAVLLRTLDLEELSVQRYVQLFGAIASSVEGYSPLVVNTLLEVMVERYEKQVSAPEASPDPKLEERPSGSEHEEDGARG